LLIDFDQGITQAPSSTFNNNLNSSGGSSNLFTDFLLASKQSLNRRFDTYTKTNFSNSQNIINSKNNNNYNNNQFVLGDDIPMLNPVYSSKSTGDDESAINEQNNNLNHPENAESIRKKSDIMQSDHCHVFKLDERDMIQNAIVWRKLIIVLVLCILFMIAEIFGGIIAKSIAIQTDAAHMAADIAGFFFSIMAIYVAGKSITLFFS
jgi:hypothetical protein